MRKRTEFLIRQQSDGSWTVSTQSPSTTSFLTGGWAEVARLRNYYSTTDAEAVDHFPDSADYYAFCDQFGPPPSN